MPILRGNLGNTVKLQAIYNYMLSVTDAINSSKPLPAGYCEDDRDGGYRSALRHFGITRTDITDSIAVAVIYRREFDLSLLARDSQEQICFEF